MPEPADLSGAEWRTDTTGCDSYQGLFQNVKSFVLQLFVEARYVSEFIRKHIVINELYAFAGEISGWSLQSVGFVYDFGIELDQFTADYKVLSCLC